MARLARAVQYRRDASEEHAAIAMRTVLAISGVLLSMLGLALAASGLVSSFDRSAFCLVTGAGLFITGALIAKRKPAGAWTYLAVVVATVSWSLRNVDVGSPLALRLTGPTVLLAILALLMPALCHWSPRRASISFVVSVIATIGLGIASSQHGPLAQPTAMITQFLDNEARGVLR